MTVNVHEAKTHLSKLLARAAAGERIVIARAGRPIAVLGPIDQPSKREPGRDRIILHGDFDAPVPEFDPEHSTPTDPLDHPER